MMVLFYIISIAVLIAAGHTPEEWKEIINNFEE